MTAEAVVNPRAKYAGWVAPLCWLAVALEGYDLVVLGVVTPALLKEPGWHLTPNKAAQIASIGLVGRDDRCRGRRHITDYIGRRKTVVWTVIASRSSPSPARSPPTRSCSGCCGSWPGSASAGSCPPRSR